MRWPAPAVALAAFAVVLAGCTTPSPDAMAPSSPPAPWQGGGTPWLAHTTGCGFCFEEMTDGWADTVVLFDNGDVLWFSFHPDDGLDDHPGGTGWPEAWSVLPILAETGSFHAEGREVTVHAVRVGHVPQTDWTKVRDAMQDATVGLEAPPSIEDHGCEDCAAPHVSDLTVPVGGDVLERDRNGPGTGNVAPGSPWHRIEVQMAVLHDWIRPGG